MSIVILVSVLLVILVAVLAIILTLKRRKKSEGSEFERSGEIRNKLDFQVIFIVMLSVILLLTIVCGTWQIWRIDKTLQSIDTNISNLNNNTSVTNVNLVNIDKDLQNLYTELYGR